MAPKALRGMSTAVARDDGQAVKFTLVTHSDEAFSYECPAEAVPEIVARLLAALEQAAMRRTVAPQFRTAPIVSNSFEVGLSEDRQSVTLALFPTKSSCIGFAVSSELARRLADGLIQVAAKMEAANPRANT